MKLSDWKFAGITVPENDDEVLTKLYDGSFVVARFKDGRFTIPGVWAWCYITNAPERREIKNTSKALVMKGHEIGRIAGGLYGQEETR